MSSTLLVAGGDSALGNSIIEKALAAGYRVAATSRAVPRKKTAKPPRPESDNRLIVPWSAQSPVSARNVILNTLSAFDAIDDAVVVHSLTRDKRPIHELPSAYLQESIDTYLKGYVFMIKELASHFSKKKSGTLSLVVNVEGSEVLTMLDALVTAAFSALAKSMVTSYQNDTIRVNGFESASPDTADFAQFIWGTISGQRTSGRWHHHGEKGGLFRPNILGRR
jgi:NAD(P)-dependent dehydrogenase (short-subunit alcohol dehydrogenase family)